MMGLITDTHLGSDMVVGSVLILLASARFSLLLPFMFGCGWFHFPKKWDLQDCFVALTDSVSLLLLSLSYFSSSICTVGFEK